MKLLILPIIFWANIAEARSFSKALRSLEEHDQVASLHEKSTQLEQKAKVQGSWGDPVLKTGFKNFPKESLDFDQTPMTGIEIGVSQSIPINSKRGVAEAAGKAMAETAGWETKDLLEKLRLQVWNLAIHWEARQREIAVLQSSLDWLSKKIEISKSLYANGDSSQQAILEIQIRQSSVRSKLERKRFEQKKLKQRLAYFLGEEFKLSSHSIDWALLEPNGSATESVHAGEKSLATKLKAKTLDSQSKRLDRVPDLNVGLGYTFRSDLDSNGDFVSLTLAMPIPISDGRHAEYAASESSESALRHAYRDYQKNRTSMLAETKIELLRINTELKIIDEQTLRFAEAARKISSTSYGLGNSSYIELLAAELSLQEVQLERIKLWSELWSTKAQLKYLQGERLW